MAISQKQVGYLVSFRIRQAQKVVELPGGGPLARTMVLRARSYARVLESMASDPDVRFRCQSLGDLLRDAEQALSVEDDAAVDYLDFSSAEARMLTRALTTQEGR